MHTVHIIKVSISLNKYGKSLQTFNLQQGIVTYGITWLGWLTYIQIFVFLFVFS